MPNEFHYQGFTNPNGTIVPDDVFDVLMPELTEAELKVLLYVVRRTFGFKKDADAISASQMINGIKTRDGRVLDRGTGLSKASVWRGINGLIEKGVLTKQTAMTQAGDSDINVYALRFREGVVSNSDYPSLNFIPPVVSNLYTQQTDSQETVKQQTDQDLSNIRKASSLHKQEYDKSRLTLIEYIADLSTEFIDTASVASSTTRAVNLFRRSGLSMDEFIDIMTEARAVTKERMASIKKRNKEGDKTKMAYFFSILEDRLGLRTA